MSIRPIEVIIPSNSRTSPHAPSGCGRNYISFCSKYLTTLFGPNSQGAATQVFLAVHPKAEGVTGKYYVDCNEYFLEGEAHNTELLKKTLKWAEEWISTH